jgi:hypothetical protein
VNDGTKGTDQVWPGKEGGISINRLSGTDAYTSI